MRTLGDGKLGTILRHWPWAAAGAAILAAAAFALAMALRQGEREEHYEVTGVEMLTHAARSEGWPALSPDGRFMVYVAEDAATSSGNLVLRAMADGEELQLTDTPEFEIAPAFSPAGDQLAFARLTNPNTPGEQRPCEFYVRAFPRGADRRVGACEVSQFIERVSWTHDGGLVYSEPAQSGGPARIVRLDIATGERAVLAPPPAEGGGDYDASVSPDGSRILFLRHGAPPASDVFVYELGGGALTQIAADLAFAHVAWAPDSRRVFIAHNAAGRREVVVRRADGTGEGERIFVGWRSILRLTSAPDLLAFHSIADPMAVFRVGPEGGARIGSGAAPDVSSRGALAFLRYGAERGLYVQQAGGAARRLLRFDELTFPRAPRWSPDGRLIVYSSTADGRSRLHIVDTASGSLRELPTPPELSAENPNWSLDGASIIFAGLGEREVRIYRVNADGRSAPEAISGPGWIEAVETRGGLIGSRLGEPGVWRLPRGAEAPVAITRLAPAACACPTAVAVLSGSHWRIVGDRLYLLVTAPVGRERIVVMDLATGEALQTYPVAGEGQPSFAYLAVDPASGAIFYARSARERYWREVGLMRLRSRTS